MKRLAALSLVLLGGCAPKENAAVLGHWTGGFVTEKADDKNGYNGYLQIYRTEEKFKMELKGRYQTLTITGDWSFKGDRLVLRTRDVQSDQPSDEEIAAWKAYFIEVDQVRSQLGRETNLKLEPSDNLVGLPMRLGKSPGHLSFKHVERSSY